MGMTSDESRKRTRLSICRWTKKVAQISLPREHLIDAEQGSRVVPDGEEPT